MKTLSKLLSLITFILNDRSPLELYIDSKSPKNIHDVEIATHEYMSARTSLY